MLISLWLTNANVGASPLNCVLMTYVQLQVQEYYAFARATNWASWAIAVGLTAGYGPFMFQTPHAPPWDKPTFWDLLWIQEHKLFEQFRGHVVSPGMLGIDGCSYGIQEGPVVALLFKV